MTKQQLIQWIEGNISADGNIDCALRLLEQNINAINNPPPTFTIDLCQDTAKQMANDTMDSDFFASLLERKASLRNAIHS